LDPDEHLGITRLLGVTQHQLRPDVTIRPIARHDFKHICVICVICGSLSSAWSAAARTARYDH
jgi:hypothetical protein